MKKIVYLGLLLFMIIGFSGLTAAKETQNEGKPFQELWNAIDKLKEALNDEKTAQYATNENLQEQIDTLESTDENLQEQIDTLESTDENLQGQINTLEPKTIKGFYIKTEPSRREFPYGGWCHIYAEAKCNPGDLVTGGGFAFEVSDRIDPEDVWTVDKNKPNDNGNGWYVSYTSVIGSVDPEEDIEFTTYAICADMA